MPQKIKVFFIVMVYYDKPINLLIVFLNTSQVDGLYILGNVWYNTPEEIYEYIFEK